MLHFRSGVSRSVMTWVLVVASALLAACASNSNYLTSSTMPNYGLGREDIRQLQLFVSPGFGLAATKEVRDDKGVQSAEIRRRQEIRKKRLVVPNKTPAVAVTVGDDFLDADVGSGLILRFKDSSSQLSRNGKVVNMFRLEQINEQPIAGALVLEGFEYRFSGGPVYLRYKLTESLKVRSETKTIKGRKLP